MTSPPQRAAVPDRSRPAGRHEQPRHRVLTAHRVSQLTAQSQHPGPRGMLPVRLACPGVSRAHDLDSAPDPCRSQAGLADIRSVRHGKHKAPPCRVALTGP